MQIVNYFWGGSSTLAGPMQEIMKKDDVALEKHVSESLPKGTFTAVQVQTLDNYNFSGFNPKPSRAITLDVSNSQFISRICYAIFAGLGVLDAKSLEGEVDKSTLQTQLLEHICRQKKDDSEIQRAYSRCTAIDLFIATDLSNVELSLRESDSIIVTYKVVDFAKKTLISLVPIIYKK